jgi:hypothetical protein
MGIRVRDRFDRANVTGVSSSKTRLDGPPVELVERHEPNLSLSRGENLGTATLAAISTPSLRAGLGGKIFKQIAKASMSCRRRSIARMYRPRTCLFLNIHAYCPLS